MSYPTSRQVIATAFCALPLAALAQTPSSAPLLDNIVVTASRTAQLEREVVGDVTVIDKEELERAGQTSVAEILARQPGVQFSRNGGPQTVTGVYVRGASPSQTLVLIDGLRINSAATGSVNWNTIDPSLIERIEIVRGTGSSLYGSNAMGGVINIITRKGGQDRPLSGWGNIGYGSYNTFKSSAGISGAARGWDYAFSASLENSDGFSATNKKEPFGAYHPDKDGYRKHGFSGSLGYSWAPGHHIGLSAYNTYLNGDYDNGYADWFGNPSHPAVSTIRQQAYTLTSTNQIHAAWESVLRFGFVKDEANSHEGHQLASRFGMLQRSYSWQNNFRFSPDHTVSVIVERLEERMSHLTAHDKDKRNTNSVGLSYTGQFNHLRTQASIRNDKISGYGNRTTGSLAFDYDFTDNWSAGLGASTGFMMPGFDRLYYPGFSNPDLKPEKSKSVEGHIAYDSDNTHVRITAYQTNYRDLFGSDAAFKPINIGKARIRGITLAGSHRFNDTTIYGSVDFMDPKDRDTGKRLIRRARQVYNLGVSQSIKNWDLGAEYQLVGNRPDGANRLGSYSLLNLTAAYAFTDTTSVQVRWNNVFDKRYSNAYGYNMPGSNVFVNLSWRM